MKRFLLIICLVTFFTSAFTQVVTFSPEVIKPKEEKEQTWIEHIGTGNNTYYMNETERGLGSSGLYKSYLKPVDMGSLKTGEEVDLRKVMNSLDLKGREFTAFEAIAIDNKIYYFFTNNKDKDIYDIYGLIIDKTGKVLQPLKIIQTSDISKMDNIGHKSTKGMVAGNVARIRLSFDKKSIISASVYERVDASNSMINISKWDADLNVISSNNYKIPFIKKAVTQYSIMGDIETGMTMPPVIRDFTEDDKGFVYAMVHSGNPEDKKDLYTTWVHQFSFKDPAYIKTYRKEFYKNMSRGTTGLWYNGNGQVMISHVGLEVEKDKDKRDQVSVNSAFIGRFNGDKGLEVLYSQKLPNEMLYTFEKEKRVDKWGYANSIGIADVLSTTDGGFYVVWQHDWVDIKMVNGGKDTKSESHLDNLLVQYFKSDKKMAWQKPVYKKQEETSTGFRAILVDDVLKVIYPDDPRNAALEATDPEVKTFNMVKFANKDIAGVFLLSFDKTGKTKRNYINWPVDKMGFTVYLYSLKYIGNNEIMGIARKVKQKVFTLTLEEYSVFKLKL